ncbi:DNA alkylation repair protein [Catellatospora sichuanensis]|uniref:DNA alkylation repair protein n=1 Tax=Catellatospora sichuanensis TaxID=1969805 RepID=UPI00118444D1|nr:DNA alkylation repair protein [Catellatospora sichuanensis]
MFESIDWPAVRALGTPRTWSHARYERIAIFCTLHFLRRGQVDDTFALAEILADDDHLMLASTTGGMLREAGKTDRARLLDYLDRYAATAPRVLLRAAIEHLEPEQRRHYLAFGR